MNKIRIIPRLDVKNNTVVKGICLEGLRVVGNPEELAEKYYREGADELLYVDAVASLYERNSLTEIIKQATKTIFVPLTVGGGIRKTEDISEILNSGADKVAINTAAIRNPIFLKEAANKFGSQCVTISVQAKKIDQHHWEAYTESGRERSGLDVLKWIEQAVELGAGEVLLTSVDKDGTKKGFDRELIKLVAGVCPIPLIVCGGAGSMEQIAQIAVIPGVDAIAAASIYHYNLADIASTKSYLSKQQIRVRL